MIPGLGLLVSALSLIRPELGLALLAYQPVIQHATLGPVTIGYPLALCVTAGLLVAVRRERLALFPPLPRLTWISLGSLTLFFVYTGISAVWSPMPSLAVMRAVKGVAILTIGWLAFIRLSASPRHLRSFLLAALIIGLLLTVVGVASAALNDWHRTLPGLPGEKRGLYRQAVGLTLILALSLFVYARSATTQKRWAWAAFLAAIAFSFWAMLQSGSRGALLAAIPVTVCVLAGSLLRREARFRALAASAAMGVGLVVFVIANPGQNKVRRLFHNTFTAVEHARPEAIAAEAERQSPLSEDGKGRSFRVVTEAGTLPGSGEVGVPAARPDKVRFVWKGAGEGIDADPSLAARLGCYKAALDIFSEHAWLGSGVGGYWTLTGGCYPHNVTLEVGAESGVFGLALLALWIVPLGVFIFRKGREGIPSGRDPLFLVVAVVFAFAVVYSQFGSVLDDNRVLFVMTPAVALVPSVRRYIDASSAH